MTLYNAIVADPAPVIAAMSGAGPVYFSLAAAPGLNRWDYDFSNLSLRESLRGAACVLEVTLKTPSASFLVAGGGKYLFVWTDEFCPDGYGRVLGLGKIDPLPSNIGDENGRVDIEAYCRLDDWQRATKNAMLANVEYDRLFYDQEAGPSTADLMACSTVVSTIDRRTLGVVMRSNFAQIDVDTSRPPGNVSAGGIVAYDVTDYVMMRGFALRKGQTVPIKKLATKFQVAWTQYAAGTCDLAPIVTLGVFSIGFFTYTPSEFKSSFPTAGASLGTGWTCMKANLVSVDYTKRFYRSTAEPAVAAALADGYETLSTSGTIFGDSDGRGAVLVPYASMSLQAGANAGMVAWYEYTQQRRETITMVTTLALNPLVTGGLPSMTGAKVTLADPTVPVTGAAWLPLTPYAQDDVAWYGGLRQVSLVDQNSGEDFDQSKWEPQAAPLDDDVSAGDVVYFWTSNTYFQAGSCVYPSPTDLRFMYRNKRGYSSVLNWLDDSANWTEGPAPQRAMSTIEPVFLHSDRGAKALKHLNQRHYATLLANARCVEATMRLRYDDLLDPETDLRAMDLSVGRCLRVRTSALTSGIEEVIGVITEFSHSMGPNGAGEVSVVLGLIPGTGLDDAAADTNLSSLNGTYDWPDPRIPVDVTLLWNPNYSCTGASRTGLSFAAQESAIQAAIDGTSDATAFSGAASAAIGPTGGNRAKITMRPLTQEGLIPLVHPTMTMFPKSAPRNIQFTT